MRCWTRWLCLVLVLTLGSVGSGRSVRAQMEPGGMPMGQEGGMPMGHGEMPATAVRVDLTTDPAPPQPRQPTTLTLTLRDASSGAPVTDLQLAHQRRLHLIIVSDDLALFSHVHPNMIGEGQFRLQYTFPSAGPYHLYADFVSAALGEQWVAMPLVVAGPAPAPAPLAEGPTTLEANSAQVTLRMDPSTPHVGQPVRLTFRLSREGQPLETLEPYLGVAGHLVAISQDLQEYVHTHPGEGAMAHMSMPMAAPGSHFGPEVTFTLTFRQPGLHKVWGQFSLDGDVITAPFVLQVVP